MATILSIVPVQAGHCGLVVVSGSDDGHRIVAAQSIELGRLVALADPVTGRDKRRDVTDEDLELLRVAIEYLVSLCGVTRIALENPSVKSLLASRVAKSIMGHATVPVEPVFSLWRNSLGDSADRRARCLSIARDAFGDESSEQLLYDSTKFAAALAAYVIGGGEVGAQKSDPKSVTVPGKVTLSIDAHKVPVESVTISEPGEPERTVVDYPPIDPDVSAGIDPGIRFNALAIGHGSKAPIRLLHLETFQVGIVVQLAKPRTVTCADGRSYQIKTKRVVTWEEVRRVAKEIVDQMRRYGVSRVTIEDASESYVHGDSTAQSLAAIGHALATEQKIAAAIDILADSYGIKVDHVLPVSWRAKLCKRWAGNMDGAKDIPRVVAMGYSNWPAESNDHTRDAGGILLYGHVPDSVKQLNQRGRTAAGSAIERLQESSAMVKVRKAATLERARAERGCKCTGKKHRKECPLHRSVTVPKWVQKALGSE